LHPDGVPLIGTTSQKLTFAARRQLFPTPLKIKNKVLVLTISTILGLDLNLGNALPITVTLNSLSGKPSNP